MEGGHKEGTLVPLVIHVESNDPNTFGFCVVVRSLRGSITGQCLLERVNKIGVLLHAVVPDPSMLITLLMSHSVCSAVAVLLSKVTCLMSPRVTTSHMHSAIYSFTCLAKSVKSKSYIKVQIWSTSCRAVQSNFCPPVV